MNKQQLINSLYKRMANSSVQYQKWELDLIIDPLFTIILETLKTGEKISIKNFGKFVVKRQKGRRFYNIQSQKTEMGSDRNIVVFTPDKNFDMLE